MRAPADLERVSVRAYQVGFGDCLLVSFLYKRALPDGRTERHVMFDFGSTRWPTHGRTRYRDIARSIAKRTGGQLDVLVITHRHKDHLDGFADDKAASTLEGLKPELVLRSWTEVPDGATEHSAARGERSRRFAASLTSAQDFALAVSRSIPAGERRRAIRQLSALAADQLPNEQAIHRIDEIAKAARLPARYLHAGQPSGIEPLIPGIRVRVLGPPTLEQWPQVASQRKDDPEYWVNLRRLLSQSPASSATADAASGATSELPVTPDPGPVRWLVERMREQQAHSLLRIIRTLDDALNNTSLILLIEAGDRRLLFPGDAQIENWSYSLTSPRHAAARRAELRDVDLYKVGHHGSRNATPRSLLELWEERPRDVVSLLSTLPGVHGRTEATAVPRAALVDALTRVGPVYRTDTLLSDRQFLEVSASAYGVDTFAPND